MAEIRPFRAWRYNDNLSNDLENLTSPLFDVVSPEQRNKLYQNPLNSIHLSVPDGENPTEDVKRRLKKWKKDGILVQDDLPGIYVYYQYFSLSGSNKTYCRKGFIANLRVYDWDEKVLLRHESTMPHSVQDRINVLDATQMNMAPTHGLYTDKQKAIEHYLDESMKAPLAETEDYQGVRDVLSVIHDAEAIREIMNLLKDKPVILADGHHRYESALTYKKMKEAENPDHTGREGYNYHMMYFTNTEADDLRILPTHRIISGLDPFDEQDFLNKLSEFFNIRVIDNRFDLYDIILGKPHAFGILIGTNAYKLRLKEGLTNRVTWNFPEKIKALDLTVMHYYIIEKCLGIPGSKQRQSPHLGFDRNFAECVAMAEHGECQVAIITQDISIDTVKEVCYSGHTLPQKSTYFYPKVICGFLFGSIDEEEFYSPFDPEFN